MADFEIKAATDGTDADDSVTSEEPNNFWSAEDHMDKLHLIASRPDRKIDVETRYGPATPALADVVVVFADDQKTWDVFKEVRVFPVVLKRKVLAGGVIAGALMMVKGEKFDDHSYYNIVHIDAKDRLKFLSEWANEHLVKNDSDGPYYLVGSEDSSSNSVAKEPMPSGESATQEDQIEPDKGPF